MSRSDVVGKVGARYLQNYHGPMFKTGLVTYDRDEGKGRKILTARLTDKGKEVVIGQPNLVITVITNEVLFQTFQTIFERIWQAATSIK